MDREHKKILVVLLTHDELMVKVDNISVANVDANDQLKEFCKAALKDTPEDETSYNFWRTLTFSETRNFDFPQNG